MIKIDKEFQALIPPLSEDEFKQLEANIMKDGIRDPLVVWHVPNGDDILIDGHNRWEIAAKHGGIPFQIKRMTFELREDVKAWIIQNQLGRRNVNDFVRSELALELKPLLAEIAKRRMKAGKADPNQKSDQGMTSKKLGKIAGVSHDTIHKVEKIKEKGTPAQIQQARSGEKSINRVYNEVMDKAIKRPPSAEEYVDQAKERHEDFKKQSVVSVSDVKQDQKDKEVIEQEIIRKFKKTLGAINDLYILIDAGEVQVNVLTDEGKNIAVGTLAEMRNRIDMISNIIRKR